MIPQTERYADMQAICSNTLQMFNADTSLILRWPPHARMILTDSLLALSARSHVSECAYCSQPIDDRTHTTAMRARSVRDASTRAERPFMRHAINNAATKHDCNYIIRSCTLAARSSICILIIAHIIFACILRICGVKYARALCRIHSHYTARSHRSTHASSHVLRCCVFYDKRYMTEHLCEYAHTLGHIHTCMGVYCPSMSWLDWFS